MAFSYPVFNVSKLKKSLSITAYFFLQCLISSTDFGEDPVFESIGEKRYEAFTVRKFLTSEELLVLQQAHQCEKNKRRADRIKAILLLNDGYTYKQIAKILLFSEKSCQRYYQSYQEGGLKTLLEDLHQGGTSKLSESQEQELKKHLSESLYYTAQAVVDYVEATYGVSYHCSSMVHLLHRLGFSYKQLKKVPGKADLNKQKEFLELYEALKKHKDPEDKIYFSDGVHPQHNVVADRAWILKGEEKEIRTNTGRKRVNFNGAYSVEDHEVVIRQDPTIDGYSTIALFNQLEKKHPESKKIYFISDNAQYYRSKLVKDYVANSRIELIYLPSYSPNLNLIERLWKFFHKKVRRKYYETFAEFQRACWEFFENLDQYKDELTSLITENFQLVGTKA